MKPRLNDQLFARCTPADRKLVERAAKLSHVRTADIIRLGATDYARSVIEAAVSKESVA